MNFHKSILRTWDNKSAWWGKFGNIHYAFVGIRCCVNWIIPLFSSINVQRITSSSQDMSTVIIKAHRINKLSSFMLKFIHFFAKSFQIEDSTNLRIFPRCCEIESFAWKLNVSNFTFKIIDFWKYLLCSNIINFECSILKSSNHYQTIRMKFDCANLLVFLYCLEINSLKEIMERPCFISWWDNCIFIKRLKCNTSYTSWMVLDRISFCISIIVLIKLPKTRLPIIVSKDSIQVILSWNKLGNSDCSLLLWIIRFKFLDYCTLFVIQENNLWISATRDNILLINRMNI